MLLRGETAIGLAYALGRDHGATAVRCLFEVNVAADARAVLARIGLAQGRGWTEGCRVSGLKSMVARPDGVAAWASDAQSDFLAAFRAVSRGFGAPREASSA